MLKSLGQVELPLSINRLKEDGLVTTEQGKSHVITLNKKEGRQLYEVRLTLEGYAVFLAATRVSEAQLEKLQQLVIDYNHSTKTENFQKHAFYECCLLRLVSF